MDDIDEFLRGDGPRIVAGKVRLDQMLTDMVFDDFADKTVKSSSARGRLLENSRALVVALDGALDCRDLPLDALETIEELRLLPLDMSHF